MKKRVSLRTDTRRKVNDWTFIDEKMEFNGKDLRRSYGTYGTFADGRGYEQSYAIVLRDQIVSSEDLVRAYGQISIDPPLRRSLHIFRVRKF